MGTSNAGTKLEVAGTLKLDGTGNGIIFPDGTQQTTAAAGGSGESSGANTQAIALLRWYSANLTTQFATGANPSGIAFDGANIWVANYSANTVTELRASDGTTLGTFSVGANPCGLAFDGANIWVANSGSNTVTKLQVGTGAAEGTFAVGLAPNSMAFDGANIWVTKFQQQYRQQAIARPFDTQEAGSALKYTGVCLNPTIFEVAEKLARFRRIEGTINRIEPSRDFVDGTYCRLVEFTGSDGRSYCMRKVFFTRKLSYILKSGLTGAFYFWNLHCYAFQSEGDLIEDIEGARASYFQRDARLLLLMAASIVLLPVVVFVALKKLLLGGSQTRMRAFLSH